MHRLKKNRGDTLIEVTIAVGIFSMVAIAVVSVISSSTSSAQSALETTVTREEIDAQAEALRFIQSSYLAGGQSNLTGNIKYKSIWEAITARALDAGSSTLDIYQKATNYNPSSCDVLYNSENDTSLFAQKAFLIDTKKLGLDYKSKAATEIEANTNEIVVGATKDKFVEASTYPRLLYSDTDSLERAEGIYVIALKDPCSTNVVGGQNTSACPTGSKGVAAYYDFYIRTCWYGPGADRPSTISTVIRLYDPEVINY